MLDRHPDTGFHYFVVIPSLWGAHMDYFAGYSALSERVPWITTVDTSTYPAAFEANKNDNKVLFLLWTIEPAPRPHRCLVAAVYSEALDEDPAKMLPDHIQHWKTFGQYAPQYDAVLAHTPNLLGLLNRGMGLPTYLFPAGWSPETMGLPRTKKRPQHRLTYWGSFAGRRKKIIPFLKHRLNDLLFDATGQFGRTLLGTLDVSAAALYIAHSPVWSFSTWRLWQGLAAGVAHIAEVGDSWPFEANVHYIAIDHLSEDPEDNLKNTITVSRIMEASCDEHRLNEIVLASYNAFSHKFTLDRCVEDFLVPASSNLSLLAADRE